jgi:hypothetical protein
MGLITLSEDREVNKNLANDWYGFKEQIAWQMYELQRHIWKWSVCIVDETYKLNCLVHCYKVIYVVAQTICMCFFLQFTK